jgi:hypothetical protein
MEVKGMSWSYAELSKAAKAAGGPEALTELLVQSGKNQMTPWIAAFALIGTGVGIGITKAVEFFKARKETSDQAVEAAKQQLIQGIKDYDAKHEDNAASEKGEESC